MRKAQEGLEGDKEAAVSRCRCRLYSSGAGARLSFSIIAGRTLSCNKDAETPRARACPRLALHPRSLPPCVPPRLPLKPTWPRRQRTSGAAVGRHRAIPAGGSSGAGPAADPLRQGVLCQLLSGAVAQEACFLGAGAAPPGHMPRRALRHVYAHVTVQRCAPPHPRVPLRVTAPAAPRVPRTRLLPPRGAPRRGSCAARWTAAGARGRTRRASCRPTGTPWTRGLKRCVPRA